MKLNFIQWMKLYIFFNWNIVYPLFFIAMIFVPLHNLFILLTSCKIFPFLSKSNIELGLGVITIILFVFILRFAFYSTLNYKYKDFKFTGYTHYESWMLAFKFIIPYLALTLIIYAISSKLVILYLLLNFSIWENYIIYISYFIISWPTFVIVWKIVCKTNDIKIVINKT
jgi:hypothetical protein